LKQLHARNLFVLLLIAALALTGKTYAAAEKLPASAAGEIGKPTGRIAFVRNKNVWVMDHRGQNQMKVCEATNADGRLSWSPDGRRIAFTRSGTINFKSPAMGEGGFHKVYDVFQALLDSAEVGATYFWYRMTDDLGSRNPEWNRNGEIILTRDMMASQANAFFPNYQVCILDPEGGNIEILRKDWQTMPEFFISPSMNGRGDIVFVHFYQQKPQGIAVLPRDKFMTSLDSVRTQSIKMKDAVSPSWSPDGKWIAYINNNMTEPGLFLTTADLSKSYLVWEPPTPSTYPSTSQPSFSPNSKWLTFATTDGSIWICDITGNQSKRISGPGMDTYPAWSK